LVGHPKRMLTKNFAGGNVRGWKKGLLNEKGRCKKKRARQEGWTEPFWGAHLGRMKGTPKRGKLRGVGGKKKHMEDRKNP